jgi:hypothetical protein
MQKPCKTNPLTHKCINNKLLYELNLKDTRTHLYQNVCSCVVNYMKIM